MSLTTFGISMNLDPHLTLREARNIFYQENGFPVDGGISQDRWSPIGCRDLKVYLPNFKWRRKAVPIHDLHHILTGYEFCPTGEFQMSAWEFAAGRYPNIYSTLFCIPLVGMGALLIPRRTFAAFVRGRRSKTLYFEMDYEKLLNRTIQDLRKDVLPREEVRPTVRNYFEYTALVACSALVMSIPFILLAAILIGVM